jgi:AraC-like DNA-binding protein
MSTANAVAESFSTSGTTDSESFEHWRSGLCERMAPLRLEPSTKGGNFFGEIRSWSIGGLTLSKLGKGGGQQLERGKAEIAHADPDVLFLTIQLAGATGLMQKENRRIARSGDVYLLCGQRAFALHCEDVTALTLTISRGVCRDRLTSFDRLHGLVRSPCGAIDRLLRDYLVSLASEGETIGRVEGEDIADHIVTLVGHALAPRLSELHNSRGAIRAAPLTRAERIIQRELCDPEFGPAALARHTGVSLRQLQILYAERGTTPMRVILQHRLALAKKRLLAAACAGSSITQIAFECGFRDLSHFGRVFIASTGVTPSVWKRSDRC